VLSIILAAVWLSQACDISDDVAFYKFWKHKLHILIIEKFLIGNDNEKRA
jgi:hypothetical protein